MKTTAIRLVLAVAILAVLGRGLGGATPVSAAGAGRIAIANVCHDGDLVPVPGSANGEFRGTFVLTIENTGTGAVKGTVLVGYYFTQKRPAEPAGQGIYLKPGRSTDVTALLGASGNPLVPDQTFHLYVFVDASPSVRFSADRTFSSIAAIPACDAVL
jgi:hypothetical protein